MDQTLETNEEASAWVNACDSCGRDLARRVCFTFKAEQSPGPSNQAVLKKCLSCALRHRPMVNKSLTAAVVVGTVLTLLNQGDLLLAGQWNAAMYWKIPAHLLCAFLRCHLRRFDRQPQMTVHPRCANWCARSTVAPR